MRGAFGLGVVLTVSLALIAVCTDPVGAAPDRPLPTPVQVRPEPQGITLADPAFTPLPDAHATFGRLGGSVYEIEVPDHWNRKLVLYMHGFGEFATEASATPPDLRHYLITHGYAWGSSSFSSTSFIPGRAADETAALWDHFARTYGRPARTYVIGLSMGGLATHIAAERYGNRYDGAFALCGAAGGTAASKISTDVFVAGAFAAGVDQAEFDAAPDIGRLIQDRIVPALRDPKRHAIFEKIAVDLSGGPRPFGRQGFHFEEETNWRRAGWLLAAHLAPNRSTTYRLGSDNPVSSRAFNRGAVRLTTNDELLRSYLDGTETTGKLQMPLLTMHTTGDGQVPIEQARMLARRVDAAGKQNLLVQRVFRDPGHCGFSTEEVEAGFQALVGWVEQGRKPAGNNVLTEDLAELDHPFELSVRPGTPQADRVPGARRRVVVHGRLTVDGRPFDARWVGAVVSRDGLVTPCQYTLPSVNRGRYTITVLASSDSTGCGAPGAKVLLWTFSGETQLWSVDELTWPRTRRVRFDASFSSTAPAGASVPTTEFSGEVFRSNGRRVAPGTKVAAYIGTTRCGVASVRNGGSFFGYILSVVGPGSIPGCTTGATIQFRVNGRPATETAVNDGHGSERNLTVP
ncbi:MAG: hypothetical protein ACXVKA_02985 [Acidimicrobiia bacterium]